MRAFVLGALPGLVAAVGISAAFADQRHQPEVFKLTPEQDLKLHVQRLEERVQALKKDVEALKTHKHEMPYGYGVFYLYLTPDGGQRKDIILPFFGRGQADNYTKGPTLGGTPR
jgi:hypothetical protein